MAQYCEAQCYPHHYKKHIEQTNCSFQDDRLVHKIVSTLQDRFVVFLRSRLFFPIHVVIVWIISQK